MEGSNPALPAEPGTLKVENLWLLTQVTTMINKPTECALAINRSLVYLFLKRYFGRSVIISTALSYTTIAPIGALVISTSLKYESAGKRFVYANYKYQKMIHE